MGVQGGYAPLKIQFNLKTYPPSRACEGLYLLYGWVREGAGGGLHQAKASRQVRPGVGFL